MTLRKLLFWMHLSIGVVAGLAILVMSVTGVLLTYEKQLLARSARALQAATVAGAGAPQPASAILAGVMRAEAGRAPTSLQFFRDPAMPVAAVMSRERTLHVDARTGQVLGEASPALRSFFREVTAWHRWFAREGASRTVARSIVDASNLGFLVLVLSGLVLWIPRPLTSQRLRQVLLFRRGLSGKARDFNWHNVAGLWMAIPLVIVVASGAVISYPWAAGLVYKAFGEEAPQPRQEGAGGRGERGRGGEGGGRDGRGGAGGEALGDATRESRERDAQLSDAVTRDEPASHRVSYDSLLMVARAQEPRWRTITLTLPKARAKDVSISIDAGTGGQPQLRRTVTLDLATAAVLATTKFEAQSPGRRMRSLLRFAHTGEVFGLWGQTIAGIASLAGALLVWTGLWLSYRRLAAYLRRRSRSLHAPAAIDRSVTA